MVDYQDSKTLVLQFYEELEAASADDVAKVMNRYMSSDYQFRGVHPFNELEGADAVAEALWKPLLGAFTQIQRHGGGGGDHSIFANSLLQILESNNGVLEGPDLFQEVFKHMRASGQNVIDQEPTFDVIPNTGDMLAPFFFVPT